MTTKSYHALEQLIQTASAFGRVAQAELADSGWSTVEQHRLEQDVDDAAIAYAEQVLQQPEGQVALQFELDWIDEANFTLLRVRNRITDFAERGL